MSSDANMYSSSMTAMQPTQIDKKKENSSKAASSSESVGQGNHYLLYLQKKSEMQKMNKLLEGTDKNTKSFDRSRTREVSKD